MRMLMLSVISGKHRRLFPVQTSELDYGAPLL